MAIEPLGSIMTLQSQTAKKPVDVKPEVENMEVSNSGQDTYVDPVTASVAKVEDDNDTNTNANSEEQRQASNDKIKKAVEELNKKMANSEAVFGVHDETNRVTIKIVDKKSKEVIKEFPPEKTLDMIAKVWEEAGILVDEKR
ncbi:MAG: flagellar protein FlaG [Lachnospiraceae bacterium]|nr:flagellar protein FlaG [Lachnospiraceae bacterium]